MVRKRISIFDSKRSDVFEIVLTRADYGKKSCRQTRVDLQRIRARSGTTRRATTVLVDHKEIVKRIFPGIFRKTAFSERAALRLQSFVLKLQAGQSVSCVITKYKTKGMNSAVPEELAEDAEYDSRCCAELLADCCATVLSPFGVSKEFLQSR